MLDNPLIEKISSSHQSNCTIIATSSNIKYNKQGEGGLGIQEREKYWGRNGLGEGGKPHNKNVGILGKTIQKTVYSGLVYTSRMWT